jgi:hypothetical protein
MATAALAPQAPVAKVWQMPYYAQQHQPLNYTFSNNVNSTVVRVDAESLNSANEMLNHIKLLTDKGIEAVKANYKLAKAALPNAKQILKTSTEVINTISMIVETNNAKLEASAKEFMQTIKSVQAESHYAVEVLTMFYNLDNFDKLDGNTYTKAQLIKKFGIVA